MQLPNTHARPHTHTRSWATVISHDRQGAELFDKWLLKCSVLSLLGWEYWRACGKELKLTRRRGSQSAVVSAILFYFQGCCSIMEPDLWPLYIERKTAAQGERFHSPQSPTDTHNKNMSYLIKSFNLLLRHLWNLSSGQILVLHSFKQDTGIAWGVVPAISVSCSVHIHSSFFQLGKVTPQRPTWPSLQRSSHLHCWCTPAEESQDLLWSPALSSAPRWWQTGGELCCHGAAPPDGGQAHQRPQTYHLRSGNQRNFGRKWNKLTLLNWQSTCLRMLLGAV